MTVQTFRELLMKALYIIAGILVALWGAWLVLMVYAFSTMHGLDLSEAARDAEQSRALFDEMPTIGFGLVLIAAGLWLAFSKPKARA